jgi:hypothetical protein
MTIDLGFAYAGEGEARVGIVDVPGHERFLLTMVAGVSGIARGLLYVAADAGPRAQTGEHLSVLDLLGVARGDIVWTAETVADLFTRGPDVVMPGTPHAGAVGGQRERPGGADPVPAAGDALSDRRQRSRHANPRARAGPSGRRGVQRGLRRRRAAGKVALHGLGEEAVHSRQCVAGHAVKNWEGFALRARESRPAVGTADDAPATPEAAVEQAVGRGRVVDAEPSVLRDPPAVDLPLSPRVGAARQRLAVQPARTVGEQGEGEADGAEGAVR